MKVTSISFTASFMTMPGSRATTIVNHVMNGWRLLPTDPSPRNEGMAYDFNILSIEVVGDQALVKVDVPLLAAHFIDFLGLLKEDNQWRIVNKMFTIV